MKTTILLMTTAAMACEIRVLTYNIHHAEGVDGKLDVPRIGRVIRDARPDIVSLQEVDVRTERVKGRDTVRELERLTGLRGVVGQSMPFQGGGYGNAVLVSGQLLGSRVFPIPNSPNMEPRSLLLVETRPYRCAQDIAFIATHLDHRSETDRITGADMANLPVSLPAILAGDLNTTANSPVFGVLMKEWANASNAEQPTIPVKDPKKTNRLRFVSSQKPVESHRDERPG